MYRSMWVLCVFFPFILDVRLVDVPARVTQDLSSTFLAVLALIFIARRIQPFLSLVDREVEFRILCSNESIVLHLLAIFFFFRERKNSSSNSRPNVSEGFEVTN